MSQWATFLDKPDLYSIPRCPSPKTPPQVPRKPHNSPYSYGYVRTPSHTPLTPEQLLHLTSPSHHSTPSHYASPSRHANPLPAMTDSWANFLDDTVKEVEKVAIDDNKREVSPPGPSSSCCRAASAT